ncbi:MAG: histidine phosphatase family protein [Alphaproteobacteria bacterium]
MTRLALLRHGRTPWNQAGRMQGRADIPLSAAARAALARRRPPAELDGALWVTSPLARAVETAKLLGACAVAIEPRLVEMDWGDWEGRTLESLRRELGPAFADNERRGLDFTPAGGESPRAVQSRLRPWLAEVGAGGRLVAAVTHKGVIRAVLALACDWDMTGAPPVKLEWCCAHLFWVDAQGRPRLGRPNLALEER